MPGEKHLELVDHKYIQGVMRMLGKIIVPDTVAYRRRLPVSESMLWRDVDITKKPGENSLQFEIKLSDVSQKQHKAYTKVAYTKDGQILEISKNVHAGGLEYVRFFKEYMDRRGFPFIERAQVHTDCLLGVNNLDNLGEIIEKFEISRNPSLIIYDLEFPPSGFVETEELKCRPAIILELLQHKSQPNLLPVIQGLGDKKSQLDEFAELCFEEIKRAHVGIRTDADIGKLEKSLRDENYRIMFVIANLNFYSNKDILGSGIYKPKKEDKKRLRRLTELSQEIGDFNDMIMEHKSEIFNSAELEIDKRSGEVKWLEEIGPEWDFYWAHS